MEEEYRMQKAKEEERKTSVSINRPVENSESHPQENNQNGVIKEEDEEVEEKDEEETKKEDKDEELADKLETVNLDEPQTTATEEKGEEQEEEGEEKKPIDAPKMENTSLERPRQAAEDDKETSTKEDVNFSFGNKRLCERWLDNLFMVLYEDLRIYTFWRTEAAHYRAQQMQYRKTGTEWELLGDLALRLWHEVVHRNLHIDIAIYEIIIQILIYITYCYIE